MLELVNEYLEHDEESEFVSVSAIKPFKHNRIWSCDYFLMDSKNFMGGTGEDYNTVIDMYNNIWNAYEYKVLGNLHL